MNILKVTDPAFQAYGKVVEGMDVSELLTALKEVPQPDDVIYVASDSKLEACGCCEEIGNSLFGGMPIQIGYCSGSNYLLNAVEYHRDSEVNVALTDLILILGKEQDIEEDFTYDTSKMEAFFIPAGTVVEVYATTLHYAPCNAKEGGFRCVVVLPKGTNEALPFAPEAKDESRLLTAVNKWLIAHEDAEIEGAVNGLKGENITIV
ncbi:MAG: DUF4867 family protein [Clostridiales bacterium]|nr:DUF4867 family protein [Clostridiales bacterium]